MTTTAPAVAGVDPRGPRFTAAITLVVFAVALLLSDAAPGVAAVITGVQAVLFAIGAGLGVHKTPTGLLFRSLVRPRLAPPDHLEDPAPPRFAQAVGLVFAVVATIGFATGAVLLGQVFAAFAFVAAFLNAVFAFCLGCEMYLLGLRLSRRTA
ncbi:DUF4395 domain-containing protein [Nocardioides daeguensis]|uniref:DUF4395 domain-containing protein n=1 Tax=Nocardioides daeguensis TaxID=908359 RepID=A0ABP6VBU5_9ACTN|nr:DUF4395 domain-containing protein [Nocardioides daeguensis]MBV6726191.1 DUF4395 domain-containing protein [Nocardioides daeguensis]MCR1772034.1 DUF4395 domain-containing protein [Nocardioides daeguensis]